MCESIVVVGAALSADVDAPTERVHSAPGARRGQSPKEPTGERAGRENTEEFRVGSHGQRKLARFAVSPTNRAANSPRARGRPGVSPRPPRRPGSERSRAPARQTWSVACRLFCSRAQFDPTSPSPDTCALQSNRACLPVHFMKKNERKPRIEPRHRARLRRATLQ